MRKLNVSHRGGIQTRIGMAFQKLPDDRGNRQQPEHAADQRLMFSNLP